MSSSKAVLTAATESVGARDVRPDGENVGDGPRSDKG